MNDINRYGTEQSLTRLTKPDTITIPQLAGVARAYTSALQDCREAHPDADPENLTTSTIVAAIILGMLIQHHHTKGPTREPVL
ncbi:MAG: hypothetical protein EBS37_16795 [Betaproteobacteria bacterium]|nr:hypothetical protein [Betaproteobacteria bacterium]